MTGFEALLNGRLIGERYGIDALIGRGGMGAVYRATDQRLSRLVAVKVVSPPGTATEQARAEMRARFAHEARAAARLHHPNVVAVYDYGTDVALDLDFIVMALLRGEDLGQLLARGARLDATAALAVLRGAARGLAAGHRAGLIHRDVKPGNLFLCEADPDGGDGVRVMDFGIAKSLPDEATLTHLTQLGRAPLSPAYAAPEQLRGDVELTPACDVYALGAVGYELWTGERLTTTEQARRTAGGAATPPITVAPGSTLDTPVGAVLLRALAPDPAARPPDAAALLTLLDAAAAGELPPSAAPAPAPARSRTKPARTARTEAAAQPADQRVACPECAHRVSTRAHACPACGAPLQPARRPRWAVPLAFVLGVLAMLALAVVLVSRGLLVLPEGASAPASPAPVQGAAEPPAAPVHVSAPQWEVATAEVDGSCGSLFDTCLRVRCTVANRGDAPGTAKVTARLVGRRSYTHTQRVRLDPGNREILVFDFPEAHNGEQFDRVTCRPQTVADAELEPGVDGEDAAQSAPNDDAAEAPATDMPGRYGDTLYLP